MTGFVQSIITIVLFIAILGVLVVIHELGHFVTARLAGVRVLEFGLGFPPRAKVLRSHGETLYTLNWLPIGGFVRLEGEDGDSDDERSFVRAPLPIKLVILIAGVVMNLLLAFAIFFAIFAFAYPAWTLTLNEVQVGSPAAAASSSLPLPSVTAIPKSTSLISPSRDSITLRGDRSRWITPTPLWCA